MQEHLILANAVASRGCYEIVEAVSYTRHLSETGHAIWALLEEWYTNDPAAPDADIELLQMRAGQRYPAHEAELCKILAQLPGKESPVNFAHVLAEGQRQALREEIIMLAADRKDQEWRECVAQFDALEELEAGGDEDTLVGTDLTRLLDAVADGQGIPLAPLELNEHIRGGLLPGMHALIFARPEMGKSLLALNWMAAASIANYRVGFWENEDAIVATQLRGAMALVGATEAELREPTRRIERALEKRGWHDRMFFRDSPGGSLTEVRQWIEKNQLDMVVINQLSKLQVRKADMRVLELGSLAAGARRLGKDTGALIVSVHQAGESAEGKPSLKMSDLEGSNTAIQADVDLMVGMGANDQMLATDRRLLSIVRNKRSGVFTKIPCRVDLTRMTVSC